MGEAFPRSVNLLRLPAIREARRRVLEDYGLFAVLSRLIEARHEACAAPDSQAGQRIMNRHAVRRLSAGNAISHLMGNSYIRIRHALTRVSH